MQPELRHTKQNYRVFLTKKRSILILIFGSLLIMCIRTVSYAQTNPIKDTLVINDESLDETIYYSARDSIYTDVKNKQVHLYGDAKVNNGEINMSAGYILIDLNKNEVLARYAYGKDSVKTEFPVFKDGSEEIKASSIRYNFNTEKGYIEELAIQQDEMYLYMGVAKRHPNEHIHFKLGRFTTCNQEEPHYHFQLSRAVMIPEERIVTGPMNLWIKGVPTPLGLPFSVIPQQKDRTHGILFPEIVPMSAYGFGVQNLGYYIPINDRMQTSVYGNLYSRGSWGLRDVFEYKKRYGFSGILDVGFQQFKSGFPEKINANKVSISWMHRKEAKSNPYWNFTSNVNFISDNQSKNNLDPLNEQYFNNSFNSDININRLFPGKPVTMGMKVSVKQNSILKSIALTSPLFNVNVTRFFPLKKFVKGTNGLSQMASRLGVTYNFEGQNRSTFEDTLLRDANFTEIGNKFFNGFNQGITVQTTAAFFRNTLKFNPSISYGNKINFQQIEKTYDAVLNNSKIDTIQKSGMIHEMSINAQFTTMVFSYYKFVGKKKPLLRHILTPSFGFRYTPQLNSLVTANVGVDQKLVTYSPFERSIYNGSTGKSAGQITFGFNNTFELKRKSDKDTITGFKKTRIIDQFSITGNYDLMADSMNLSDISLDLRINPIEWINFVASSTFSPYGWVDSTGAKTSNYAINSNGTLGRFMRNDFTTTLTLTSKESRKELEKTQETINNNWNADFNYYALHPEYILNFNIPWKASLSHVYTINMNTQKTTSNPETYQQIQTLVVNGDLSFTKRWKLAANVNFDLKDTKITNARFTLSRNMHCWALSLYYTPIGGNKSFLLSIRNTSTLFQDAKIDIRKPPVFL